MILGEVTDIIRCLIAKGASNTRQTYILSKLTQPKAFGRGINPRNECGTRQKGIMMKGIFSKRNKNYHLQQNTFVHQCGLAYLVGAGIASLAAAVYLIRDGGMPGNRIYIFDESDQIGGSLDAQGSPQTGYVMRGARMFSDEAYTCTFDLLSSIPSLSDPRKTVREEMIEFNKKVRSHSKSRLVESGKKIDASALGLSWRDRLDLLRLLFCPEILLRDSSIEEHFSASFFKTNFWFEWCTTFAFEPWHSAVEFRRYAYRFIQELPRLYTLGGVRRTPYNQYQAIILPILVWLQQQGVNFKKNCQVINLDFKFSNFEKTVQQLFYIENGSKQSISITSRDYVLVTIGSMTEDTILGSMNSPPKSPFQKSGGGWLLWENLAKKYSDFGKPSVFCNRINESKWESFTITFRDNFFIKKMEEFTGNQAGTGGLVTFKDSNWLMSVVLYYNPHFINQPKDVNVAWGYGLFPDKKGNFVDKKMSECSGEEILIELCSHLNFQEFLPDILKEAICVPCMMPYITSQFLTRKKGDRPSVVPKGATNIAFIGQYCEIPNDVVFTVDYSVRSAQMAVYSLLKLNKKVTPIYKGYQSMHVLINAFKTMIK